MVVMIPTLLDLCIQTAIDNIKYIGDVGETDINLLKYILPHCTVDQLIYIETSTEVKFRLHLFVCNVHWGRDLSAVTDKLWKQHYEKHFGVENANVVIRRMKKVQRSFKWRELYKAKLKERDEAQKKSVGRLKELYAQEVMKKQSRQIRICTKVPPSSKKRSFFEGSGSCNSLANVKGNLMKKAKLEYLNSHEVKVHAAMRKNAFQRQNASQSSLSQKARASTFSEMGASQKARVNAFSEKGASTSSTYKTSIQPSMKRR